ncbi:uncharacterized protein LOC123549544 [Mercenaria mercenaria]|uniref:uncharacterized protein LOC123549544 n=1 Tax=Mercenaria mercenaria TaxID=6596 RepID=UPI00234EA4C9|nr:uncharacterized protein LOC123549544 [Mercenaria mercenaria]
MKRDLLFILLLDLLYWAYGGPPVYVSNGTHIVSYSKFGTGAQSVLGQRDYRIVGLAIDVAKNKLFWSDISFEKTNRGIYTSDLQGQNITRIVYDVGEVNGLTVDWVSRHIYWTDLERKTIEVSNYDGSARRIIVSSDLKTPRAIVASPIYGYIFWADQRNHRIERAWLDGSHRRTVVKSSSYFPNQLAISIKDKQLYWVDTWEHAVFSSKLNGKKCKKQVNLEQVTKGSPGFGLLVFGNTAVISTWFNTAIYSLMLNSKKLIWQQEVTNLGTRELFSLISLNPATQPMTYHPCLEEDNGGCSHLCLPTHKTQYVCACPTYGGLALSSDGKTCKVPEEALMISMEDTGNLGFIAIDHGWSTEVHLISSSKSPGAITYDRRDHMVYWSDTAEGTIYRSRIEGTENAVFLDRTNGIGRVDDLSFNSVTGCLYFTNAVLIDASYDGKVHSLHSVEMIEVHTENRITILKSDKKPIRILVDEIGSYLYIVLAGHSPEIVRTDLDGANATTLSVNVSDPLALAITGEILTLADRRYENNSVETALLKYNTVTEEVIETVVLNKTTYSIATSTRELFLADAVQSSLVVYNGTEQHTLLEYGMVADLVYTVTDPETEDHITKCIKAGCSHGCVPLPSLYPADVRCVCPSQSSLVLHSDQKNCKRPDNFLLYADINKIQMLSLDKDLFSQAITIFYGDGQAHIASLAYDESKERVYWADRQSKSIYLSHLHQIEPILVYKQDDPLQEMIFDPRRQRLYWSSKFENSLGYYISSLNMKRGLDSLQTLFSYHRTMKSLSLHPKGKWLYWIEEETEFEAAGIGSCKSKPEVRYNNVLEEGLQSPNSLFVTKDKLYIAEKGGKILVVNLEGKIMEVIYPESPDINYLIVHQNVFIVSDTKENLIKVTDIKTGVSMVLADHLDKPSAVAFHYSSLQMDACDQSECTDNCIPLLRNDYVCTCLNGKALLDDRKTCIEVPSTTVTQITSTTTVRTTTPKTTTSTTTTPTPETTTTTPETTTTTTTTYNPVKIKWFTYTSTETSSLSEVITEVDKARNTSSITFVRLESSSQSTESKAFEEHTGEPKPTQSTEEIIYVTDESLEHVTAPDESRAYKIVPHDDVKVEPIDYPYFENCPGETIIARVPSTDKVLELPIKPAGYDSNGSPLPLHCDKEMTESGVIIPWKGDESESRQNVTFFVTDSLHQKTKCTFTVILQDVDPPKFTFCPDTVKVRTDERSAIVNWTLPEAVDNVKLKLTQSSHSPGNHFGPGETRVNYTAIDIAGNTAACLFSVFVLHDHVCNLPDIHHGGIICNHGDGVTGECKVICEEGYVLNPIRTFRRMFNCRHPDDIDALNKIMSTQEPCLKHDYPSLLRQRFSFMVNGPISLHKTKVRDDMNLAIVTDLEEEKLCIDDVCQLGNISIQCDEDVIVDENENGTCLDEEKRMEFFISFNITLSNSTGVDVETLLHDIHLELISLASLLQLQIEGHMYMAIAESLSKTEGVWTCPVGRIQENGICISCPPGTFHNITLNVCQYCTMGYYQDNNGQIACHMCDPGRTSPDGATSSNQCHAIPSMDEMTLFIIVTTCSFGVVFLCMAITLYLQFQRQKKRNQQASYQKKTRYNMSPNVYVAPPPILKSKLDENYSSGHKTYSIDRKKPINMYANHDYEDVERSPVTGPLAAYQSDLLTMLQGQSLSRDYSPGEEVPTGTLSRENTFSNPTYSPQFGVRRGDNGSLTRGMNTPSPGPQRKMSYDSTFSNQSPRTIRSQRTPTSDTPLITQSPLLRLKLAAYNLNHED